MMGSRKWCYFPITIYEIIKKNTSQHNHATRRVSYYLTSHLGDSGMKKSPTSRTAQGTNPA